MAICPGSRRLEPASRFPFNHQAIAPPHRIHTHYSSGGFPTALGDKTVTLVAGIIVHLMCALPLHFPSSPGRFITPILQVRKPRYRKLKQLAHSHGEQSGGAGIQTQANRLQDPCFWLLRTVNSTHQVPGGCSPALVFFHCSDNPHPAPTTVKGCLS